LVASFDPFQYTATTDSFYVWLGNCPSQIRFDFSTASVPDAADIFYLDLQGNRRFAGSIPYFGGNCNNGNYFTDPTRFPPSTALSPQYCLPGFVELYGAGIPLQDSMLQRNQVPADFKLGGGYWESARLHLNIPEDIVALLFVVKFNPDQATVLRALWDCTPSCCVSATGDSVCAGDSIQLGTLEEAISYAWTGPNGFISNERNPVIAQASPAAEGWYKVEASYLFECSGVDSVYIQVNSPQISIKPDTVQICLGSQTLLEAQGASNYVWDMRIGGIISTNGAFAQVSPQTTTEYIVSTQDEQGCVAEAKAVVIPESLSVRFEAEAPSCPGMKDGRIQAIPDGGQVPFSIRLGGSAWQPGTELIGLASGTYPLELRDAAGCWVSGEVIVEEAEPVLAAIGGNPPSCTNSCNGELAILTLQGKAPYSYYLNDSPVDSVITEMCAGTYQARIQDARGCTWTESYSLEEPNSFSIDLGKDRKVREGKEISLSLDASESLDEIFWPGYCEEACEPSLTLRPDSSQWIIAEAWNSSGCHALDSVFVQVKKKAECSEGIYAPTAFTPNGDGVNERFTLYADTELTDVSQIQQLIILNKWGNVVWSKSSMPFNAPELGWDGYARGKKIPEGTYTWAGSFTREDGLSFKCGGSVIVMR